MNTKGSKKARKDFFTGMGFILPSLFGIFDFYLYSCSNLPVPELYKLELYGRYRGNQI